MNAKRSLREILDEKIALAKKEKEAQALLKEKEQDKLETACASLVAEKAIEAEIATVPTESIAPIAMTPREKLAAVLAERLGKKIPALAPTSSKDLTLTVDKTELDQKLAVSAMSSKELLNTLETKREEQEKLTSLIDQAIPYAKKEQFALDIVLNEKQLLAKELAFAGTSFVLTGAAGTGKTATQRAIAKSLLEQDKFQEHSFRIQGTGDRVIGPSIAFCAYTRTASGNLRRAIHKDPDLEEAFKYNITTIHNLLEYSPEFYINEEGKETMRFRPVRTANNPLTLTHLIVEEASQVGLRLWMEVIDALPEGCQIILLGDINQLPPFGDPSVLNYALIKLPVVELTHVYRQAEGSPILDNAHRVLANQPIIWQDKCKLIEGPKVQSFQGSLALALGKDVFKKWWKMGIYDPDQDIILSPFNKQELGTINMNKWIAQFLGEDRNAVVFEIRAGINKVYLAVGDTVFCNKQKGIITKISTNMGYSGKDCQSPGPDLTRFGVRIHTSVNSSSADIDDYALAGYEDLSVDRILDNVDDKEGSKRNASHIVTVAMESGIEEVLSSAGDFADSTFSLGYALTVHKAQGGEWRKVWLLLHKDHASQVSRELLYTAMTRAREEFFCVGKEFMVLSAIHNPRIKGNSVQEKIEYFNSGLVDVGSVQILKG